MENKKIEKFLEELSFEEKKYILEKLKTQENRKRNIQVKFFVDEKELETIEKKIEKSKLSKSDYLRKCSLEKEILVIEEFKEFFIELKKQGTNINQIAKALNQGIVVEINFKQIEEEYKKLNDLVGEIVRRF